jgi:hypothetical protein
MIFFPRMENHGMRRSDKIFFALGTGLFLYFLYTGRVLTHVIKPALGEDAAHRMMARASHIYILFDSLLLILASLIETDPRARILGKIVFAGKLLLTAAAGCLIDAFRRGHSGTIHDRGLVLYGVILALAGTILLAAQALSRPGRGNQ